MKLALRTTAATDADWLGKLGTWLTKWRLVTKYPHGGIVIGDTLYHANAKDGLNETSFTPERWELIDLGDSRDAEGLELFKTNRGMPYDWFGLLAFVLPGRFLDRKRIYCYVWCWWVMTGERPTHRVTAEMLLAKALEIRNAVQV